MMLIEDNEIKAVEQLLLPGNCHFSDDAKEVIRCWESKDIAACPGSGKTTILLAKLKILADRMPFENGSGICVLSHTNVAVNEIKTKLTDYAGKLTGYPNYIGTIQSFIDQFVTMPYLRRKFGTSVQVVDTRTYAEHLHRLIKYSNYTQLKGLISNGYNHGSGLFADEISYVGSLYLNDAGALCIQHRKAALAGVDRPSTTQFQAALRDMIVKEKMIHFSDAYQYAKAAVKELSTEYTDLFCSRFSYVFVDEYQDCREDQREALTRLFDSQKCCVINIGDSDQAIYGSDKDAINDWQPSGQYLSLKMSNRYGQEIADILRPLRTGQQTINTSLGKTGYKPILFIFDNNTISLVKHQFIHQLEAHGLTDEKGIYKAIGHIRNSDVTGLKIGSYWDGFDGSKIAGETFRFWSVIDEICDRLNAGQMYLVEPLIRRLLCRIFHYAGVFNAKTGLEYTLYSLKKSLDEKHFDEYRGSLIAIAKLSFFNRTTVSAAFNDLVEALFASSSFSGRDVMKKLPNYFMSESVVNNASGSERNVYIDPIRGRRIKFDTVHGVKGETHDATLYLETEMGGASDIVRILPWLGVGRAGTSKQYDYCRKLAYVGMSRPKTLLCLAVQESTYNRGKSAFQEWDIVDLRNQSEHCTLEHP